MTIKLLANENFPAPSVAYLRARGYDLSAISEQDAGIKDSEVLRLAIDQERWILTFDRDYGELLFARRLPPPPAVLLFRLTHYRPEEPGLIVANLLSKHTNLKGYFTVVSEEGLRKRALPVNHE